MARRTAFTMAAVAILLVGTTATASGGVSVAESTVAEGPSGGYTLVKPLLREDSTIQVSCGNTFVPSAPAGGPMVHYYKNCNGYSLRVTTGFRTAGGTVNVYDGVIVTVADQQTVSWSYSSTQPVANYLTSIVLP